MIFLVLIESADFLRACHIIYIYSILHILTIVFHGTRTVEYQPIFHGVTYRISSVRMRPLLHCALEYKTTNASRPT